MTKKLVVPGEFVAVCEEYMPGKGTYDQDGKIFSAYVGELELDHEKKEARVKALNPPVQLKVGDDVYGVVRDMRETMVVVDVSGMEGKDRTITGETEGSLHISKISDRYTEDIRKEYRKGDIIRAVVIRTDPSLQLATDRRNLGVIRALCTRCRSPLTKKDRELYCESCERTEFRKTAIDYSNPPEPMQKDKNFE
ncbi:MAG: exosome complex RNA-binding protein Csl4 [Methanobacteriota archaeon]|nr:MAG: exosome complex RNA-binding protein Csl4 [Euryarchaeota archaeon]